MARTTDDREALQALLQQVAAGTQTVEQATRCLALQLEGVTEMGFARLDTDRRRRTGVPEVVLATGKTHEQLRLLVEACLEQHGRVLVTRVAKEHGQALQDLYPALTHDPAGRILCSPPPEAVLPRIAVLSAGTSDQTVSEEAAAVLAHLGHAVDRLYDVGVAGIHRLFNVLGAARQAKVIIVVAGMEGALPSVVAGLVAAPVVAVPTSIGYGASFGGLAALLAMLNSCASGIGVVNIDNGFGAAMLAHRIAGGQT